MSKYIGTLNFELNIETRIKILFVFIHEKNSKNCELDFLKNEIVKIHPNEISKVNVENYDLIITDSKKIYKKYSDVNILLYKKNKVDDILISINNLKGYENIFSKNNTEYSIDNNSIFDLIKKAKFSTQRIIKINGNKFSLAYRFAGSWKIIPNTDFEILYNQKNKEKIKSTDFEDPWMHHKLTKINSDLTLKEAKICGLEKISIEKFESRLKWATSDTFIQEIISIQKVNKEISYTYTKFKCEKEEYDKFLNKILDKKEIKGVEFSEFKIDEQGRLKLKTKYGNILLSFENGATNIWTNFHSIGNEDALIIFSKGIIKNIKFSICNVYVENKISKKNIFKTLASILVLIILLIITFNYIYNPETISTGLKFVFSGKNFKRPWIYLIILSTITTFLWPFLVSVFFEKYILKKEKLEFSRLLMYFFAGMLRKLSIFITGNLVISIFIWGWYISKNTEIRAVSLASSVAWASIIRAVIYSVIGTIFMIIGSISYWGYYSNGASDFNIIFIFIISWIGFIWEIIHSSWIYLLIISPFIYMIFNQLNLRFRKNLNREIIDTSLANTLTMTRQIRNFSFKKQKNTFIRISILISGPLLIEGFETILYFNMIEAEFANNFKFYWNFFSLSGLRMVAGNIHNFPIINILPGNGLGFTEYGLTQIYTSVFEMKHIGEIDPWNGYSSDDLAQMTSVTTRLFNVYIINALTLLISIYILAREFIFKSSIK